MTAASRLSLAPASRVGREDYFGNPCEWFSIDQPHTMLEVLAESRVHGRTRRPSAPSRDSLPWEEVRALLENAADEESARCGAVHVRFPADQLSQATSPPMAR